MLFEEFLKKKKIALAALQQGEPELFLEFQEHYEQMGEKSFDHTKKYWFNKLRRLYPLPPEVKTEKPRMENQVAEQTVADTLTEPTPRDAAPGLGFKPKFKAGTTAAKPAADIPPTENTEAAKPAPTQPAEPEVTAASTPAPKLGFKPKFKTAAAKPADEQLPPPPADATPEPEAEIPTAEAPAAKPAYKPRFQAKNLPGKPAAESEPVLNADLPAEKAETPAAATQTESPITKPATAENAPKLGFKPRFKTAAPAPPAEALESIPDTPVADKQENTATNEHAAENTNAPVDDAAPKPAYKPRFNPKMVKPQPPDEGAAQ